MGLHGVETMSAITV